MNPVLNFKVLAATKTENFSFTKHLNQQQASPKNQKSENQKNQKSENHVFEASIPSSHELALLQKELVRLNEQVLANSKIIKENRKAVNEWMLENPDLAPQTSSSKQGKIKLKIKDEVTGQGSIIKLEDPDETDGMDIDIPEEDELLMDTPKMVVKSDAGGVVSISSAGMIKVSADPNDHNSPSFLPPGRGTDSKKNKKKLQSVKNSRIKKRSSLNERELSTIRATPELGDSQTGPAEGDYSHIKGLPPNQIPIATFWSFMEQYFRNIAPEDLQALANNGDEVTPFMIPPSGLHYTLQWKEEEQRLISLFKDGVTNLSIAANKEYVEVDNSVFEGDLQLGSLSERFITAFLKESVVPDTGAALIGLTSDDDFVNISSSVGAAGAGGGALANRNVTLPKPRTKTDLSLYEERLRAELVHLGLLPEEEGKRQITSSNGEPTEIVQLLIETQQQLRQQIQVNSSRKRTLLKIAEEYMANQEFNTIVDDINKTVEAAYIKKFKSNSKSKKKEKSSRLSSVPMPSRGMAPDTILQILDSRQRLLEDVGKVYFPMEKFQPPTSSIYNQE